MFESRCGACDEFPCELLSAVGKEAGFDPEPRLSQYRMGMRIIFFTF